jgi:predicted N-acetyltransferase YhbS
MIMIRNEQASDAEAREALLDQAFGKNRRRKTSERLRSGRLPANELAFVAVDGKHVVGTARLWNIVCGSGQFALLLGPVAVEASCHNRGIGADLVRHALHAARQLGHGAVILVGDAPYYGRFGFTGDKMSHVQLPGPVERHRLLAIELEPGTLDSAQGMLSATGEPAQKPQRRAA